MTPRNLFQRIMRHEPVDRLPVVAIEPYDEAGLARWRHEGLPEGQSPEEHLGMDSFQIVPISFDPLPAFERRTIYEDNEYLVETDHMGATIRRRKDAPLTFYGFIDHPVKSRGDWERYKARYDTKTPGRIPADLDKAIAELNASDRPVRLDIYPFFFRQGFFLMGMERFMTAFYDMPDLMHDMFSFWSEFVLELISPFLSKAEIDCVTIVEDLAYKNGPHVSRAIYKEFWLPYQDPIVSELRKNSVPVICLWTAGNIFPEIPLFLEHGINCTWPVERASGMSPLDLRKQYGRDLLLGGGVPKEALIGGPSDVDKAFEELMPLIEDGGFLPALDDMVPPEVPLDTYRYYINRMRAIRL